MKDFQTLIGSWTHIFGNVQMYWNIKHSAARLTKECVENLTKHVFKCIMERNQIFGINKHSHYGFMQFFKNLLVLIFSKLHSKSRDYLYKSSGTHKLLWLMTDVTSHHINVNSINGNIVIITLCSIVFDFFVKQLRRYVEDRSVNYKLTRAPSCYTTVNLQIFPITFGKSFLMLNSVGT